ncbi:MAG TPA: HAMP domain-containing sensor histidine kinase, partial [Thermoanaerobaculia bacterium]|nr:HAMP domain-containing sensor histidine kinase [Thermoanaerobaculia bacterium]
ALAALLAAAVIFAGYELRVSRLRRRTGELTRLVEERTERLVELDKRKNEFVATVSHELRNPLTSIRGTLELLSSGMLVELPKEAVEILKLAHKNTLRLGRLIDDLIDLEKLESGTLDIETRRVALRDVLRSAVDANRGLAQAYGVRIETPVEPPDVPILVDEERLLQVLTNLLSNAVKFSPEEEAVVLAAEETPGGVRITVTDRGPGVPEEFRDKIFTRYAQAQTTTRRTKKGTGLGLWIAKGFVDRMGGTIGFTSAAGEGTTFWVELPRAPDEGGGKLA